MIKDRQSINLGHQPNRANRSVNWGVFLRILLLLAIVALIIYFFFYSNYFMIEKSQIQGTVLTSKKQIDSLVKQEIKSEANILFFPSNQLEEKIEDNFSLILQATVQKGIPDTIRVLVEERKPVLIWQTANKNFFIDQRGIAFTAKKDYQKITGEKYDYLPTVDDQSDLPVEIGQKVAAKDWINFISELDKQLIEKLTLQSKKFTIKGTTFDLTANTEKGKIYFDTSRAVDEQIKALTTALKNIKKKKFDYLDIRIKGWVYYKY